MAKVERTITINAPVEKVFGYVTEPTSRPEIWPSMVEVKGVQQTPEHIGTTFQWVYKMAGLRFEGSSTVIEYVANQRVTLHHIMGQASSELGYHPSERILQVP